MTFEVDPDWWKSLFDDVYLITDARSVADEAVTRKEIDIFSALIPLQPGDHILDLCGGHGRHARALCRRGFRNCTVLDYSRILLDIGRRNAAGSGDSIEFVQGDARHTSLAAGSFDHVLILGNSLGYLPEADADLQILRESRRLLKPGGYLLVDVTDGQALPGKLAPRNWHEIGEDMVVCRHREVIDNRVQAREVVLSKAQGLIRDRTYSIRLHTAESLVDLASRAGFARIKAHGDLSALRRSEDVGFMNHRLVITARKTGS